ncbi:MAG: acyltransferase [Methylophaga sp.]|nr:acyltransferase [Methylophaga sp.]
MALKGINKVLEESYLHGQINAKGNNFDIIRLLLAMTVAIVHLSYLSNISFLSGIDLFLNSEVAVDSFFVISGFLIFRSFESSKSIGNYTRKRLRRIFPGYITVILLCSIFLYFASSRTDFFDYFNLEFLKYIFFNILTLNFFAPTLPGVFENNQIQAVNGALWTIKIEVMFYMVVPFISYMFLKSNRLYVIIAIYVIAIMYSYGMIYLNVKTGSGLFLTLERQLPGQLAFFISGAATYYYYSYFYENKTVLIILAVTVLVINSYIADIYLFYPFALAIIVIFFATIFRCLGNFGKYGDLSFGVYIWHFPILQFLLSNDLFTNQVVGLGLFLVCTFIASYLSWHLVEKRYLYVSSHYLVSEKK